MVNDSLHPFPRLPTELRKEIQRLCLPHQVCGMDAFNANIIYDVYEPEDKIPCSLHFTHNILIFTQLLS